MPHFAVPDLPGGEPHRGPGRVEERARRKDDRVAIVRIEKLYPWWPQLVSDSFASYNKLDSVFWVQDEPANMGAATFVAPRLAPLAKGHAFDVICRAESASPATGSHKAHVLETKQIMDAAFRD